MNPPPNKKTEEWAMILHMPHRWAGCQDEHQKGRTLRCPADHIAPEPPRTPVKIQAQVKTYRFAEREQVEQRKEHPPPERAQLPEDTPGDVNRAHHQMANDNPQAMHMGA